MTEHAELHELEHNKETPDAAVSIRERVKSLELVVRQGCLNNSGHLGWWALDPADPILESANQPVAEGGRDEPRILIGAFLGPIKT